MIWVFATLEHDSSLRGILIARALASRNISGASTRGDFYEKSWFIGFSSLPAHIQTWVRNNDERAGVLNGLQRIGLPATSGAWGTPEDIKEKRDKFWRWFVIHQLYMLLFAKTEALILHVQKAIRSEIVVLDKQIEEIEIQEKSKSLPYHVRAFLRHKKAALKDIRGEYQAFEEQVIDPAADMLGNQQSLPSAAQLEGTNKALTSGLASLKERTAQIFRRGKEKAASSLYNLQTRAKAAYGNIQSRFASAAANENAPGQEQGASWDFDSAA